MSALPTLNIPVVVNTAQVDPAIRTAVMPGLGALGAGPLGGVLGGVAGTGTIGMGIAGVGAAFMAPILAATKLQDALNAQTKGAAQAFEEYKKTGVQTAQLNAVLLERLANLEKQQAGGRPMGFMAAFEQANISVNQANFSEGMSNWWQKRATETGAFLGTMAGGGTAAEAALEAQISTAGQGVALQAQAELNRYRQLKQAGLVGPNASSPQVGPGGVFVPSSEMREAMRQQVRLQQELVRQGT
jgi:hypothetical protein